MKSIFSAHHNSMLAGVIAAFFLFLIATFSAWKITNNVVKQEANRQFYEDTGRIRNWIQHRLDLYLLATESLKEALEINNNITSDQWTAYLQKLNLIEKYPGISSISYSEKITTPEKTAYIVKYIEPVAGREKALGFDLTSEENRKLALERARDTGNVAATGKITFTTTDGPGFSFYFPVYKNGINSKSTIEERRANILGIVGTNFRGTAMFRAVYGRADPFPDIDFEIYQGNSFLKENLLYDHDPLFKAFANSPNSQLTAQESIDIDSQKWAIIMTTKNGLGLARSQEILPLVVLIGGTVISFLLAGFFFFYWRLHVTSH